MQHPRCLRQVWCVLWPVALCTHTHTALFSVLSTSRMLVIRSVFVKLVPAVCLRSRRMQRLMPTVCLIIAECSALNTCGIIVICTVLVLSVCSTRHTRCARGVGPAAADVCSAFSLWSQLWFHVCQALSNPHRQHFVFKVCPVPVRFGIRNIVLAPACSLRCAQCFSPRGAISVHSRLLALWPALSASAACSACSGLSL